jgi:hypothetical protein
MKTATFDDGVKVNYEIIENNPDKIKPGVMRIAFGTLGINYQYLKPKQMEINGGLGFDASVNGSILYALAPYEKEKKGNLSLKSQYVGANTVKVYVIKDVGYTQYNFFGVHGGVKYALPLIYKYSYLQTAIGLGHFKTKHMAYFVEDKSTGKNSRITYTKRSGFYADLLFFPTYAEKSSKSSSSSSTSSKPSQIGAQLYFDGSVLRGTRKGKEFGMSWQFGVGFGLSTILPVFGIGVAF